MGIEINPQPGCIYYIKTNIKKTKEKKERKRMRKDSIFYPVIIDKNKNDNEKYYNVYIPDLDTYTEGETIPDAMEMARDAIGLKCITMQDEHINLPIPSEMKTIKVSDDKLVTLIDVDLFDYRRKNELRTVRRNVSIPSWINYEAEKSGINVSALLVQAIKTELKL